MMASDDYEVGYGKPPRHSRFQPGKSGNPKGRRKGSRGLKTDLHAELSASHTIQINGRPIRGSRQQLMVKTLATRAASGDLKAQALLIPLILQVFGIEDRGGEGEADRGGAGGPRGRRPPADPARPPDVGPADVVHGRRGGRHGLRRRRVRPAARCSFRTGALPQGKSGVQSARRPHNLRTP